MNSMLSLERETKASDVLGRDPLPDLQVGDGA